MTSLRGVLVKIVSTHNNLRTNEVRGEALDVPEVGKRFTLVSPPLGAGFDIRLVTTTEVEEVVWLSPTTCTFKTQNSTYRWEGDVCESLAQ